MFSVSERERECVWEADNIVAFSLTSNLKFLLVIQKAFLELSRKMFLH